MKMPTLIALLLFVLTVSNGFGQGEWIEENVDPDTGLRTGKIEIRGEVYEIKPNANLENAQLYGADLSRANLTAATFERANIFLVDFTGADLFTSNLSEANLVAANFTDANLVGADLRISDCEGADFTNANLKRAFLSGASLKAAKVKGANLEEAELISTYLKGADFDGTNLLGANLNLARGISSLENEEESEIIGSLITGTTLPMWYELTGSLRPKIRENEERITKMENQLETLVASIAEKDAKIAELEQGGGGQSLEQVLEQVRDARAGSVVLTIEPDGNNITLGLTIEQSDNLTEWTKLDGEMTRTIPIPDGKKFYRFALDK
ncbi:pentapeptide repeat-containing protein [Akkermansiaceae bacterium]|nr:pentapeptide repeat-containing protein [Akkermansiaceae bacterium]